MTSGVETGNYTLTALLPQERGIFGTVPGVPSSSFYSFGLNNHPRADGFIGELVDDKQASRLTVTLVTVVEQRFRRTDVNTANVVQANLLVALYPVQGVYVYFVFDLLDDAAGVFCGVLDGVFASWFQRFLIEPAYHQIDILTYLRLVVRFGYHVTATYIDVVIQRHGNGHGRVGFFLLVLKGFNSVDGAGKPRWKYNNLIARLKHTPPDTRPAYPR